MALVSDCHDSLRLLCCFQWLIPMFGYYRKCAAFAYTPFLLDQCFWEVKRQQFRRRSCSFQSHQLVQKQVSIPISRFYAGINIDLLKYPSGVLQRGFFQFAGMIDGECKIVRWIFILIDQKFRPLWTPSSLRHWLLEPLHFYVGRGHKTVFSGGMSVVVWGLFHA